MPEPAATVLEGCRIGYFGHYDPSYARNRVLMKALRRAGASVVPVNDRGAFPRRTPRLLRAGHEAPLDAVLVGFPGHSDVPAAKLLSSTKGAPLIFDPLVSLWETDVVDRRVAPRISLRSFRLRQTDRVACLLAEALLFDTWTHSRWFQDQYGVPARKCSRVWVGADDDTMKPAPPSSGSRFNVFFYGSFIPLHGVEHVLRAAQVVEGTGSDVRFILCGSGQTYPEMRSTAERLRLRNVEFVGRRRPAELARSIADSDLCLGVFGTSPKAQRVIPNKVFDALACRRPVVTGDTPAAREALVHGSHAWLCPVGDAGAVADAVLRLRDDTAARERLAAGGYELFRRRFSTAAIARELGRVVGAILGNGRRPA